MTLRAALSVLLSSCVISACGTTGQERLEVNLAVRGTERPSLDVNGSLFTLTRAQVAVGPLYFCAAEGADAELCEVALAQLTEVVIIDALTPLTQTMRALPGTTGEVQSALYDYGISWLLTAQRPEPGEGVEHSAILEGTVARAGVELRFTAAVDVLPTTAGGTAVHAQRTQQDLVNGQWLTLAVDPYLWLRPIDVDALFALDTQGTGQVTIERGSQAYEAILQSMQNRAPVQFEWSPAEP